MMKKLILNPMPISDYSCGPYNYFVETPEGEVMYFENKKKAKEFIEFYKTYTEKRKQKVL
jgi:hypothetical protein